MGRVAKLHYGLSQISSNYKEKKINFEVAEQLHLGACIESIAESIAWYMDRTEKRDRYDDALPDDNTADEFEKRLIEYVHENYGANQVFCELIEEIPIREWLKEIKEGTENGK